MKPLRATARSSQGQRSSRRAHGRGSSTPILVWLGLTVAWLAGASAVLPLPLSGAEAQPVQSSPWLAAVNTARAQAKLDPVSENSTLGVGAGQHSRYVVTTGQLVHGEDPSNPNYTKEGNEAGTLGLVRSAFDIPTPVEDVEELMRAPFHALGIIDPGLRSVGYGVYRDLSGSPFRYSSTLALDRRPLQYRQGVRVPTKSAIWPGDGATVRTRTMGVEDPDPLTGCNGYTSPVGLPIVANLGDDLAVTTSSLEADGVVVPTCLVTGEIYINADPVKQDEGRAALRKHQVILIPRDPLRVGVSYQATIVAGSKTLVSRFQVAARVPDRIRTYNFTINDQHMILVWEPPDDGGLPIDRYLVDIEPDGIHSQLNGSSKGANFEFALSPGPAKATIRAVNKVGAGDPITFGFDVPASMASTTTSTTEPPSTIGAATTTTAARTGQQGAAPPTLNLISKSTSKSTTNAATPRNPAKKKATK